MVTDDAYQTSVPGIWALGDLANHFQLKLLLAAEPAASQVVEQVFRDEGISVRTGAAAASVLHADDGVTLRLGSGEKISAGRLLAVGRLDDPVCPGNGVSAR